MKQYEKPILTIIDLAQDIVTESGFVKEGDDLPVWD